MFLDHLFAGTNTSGKYLHEPASSKGESQGWLEYVNRSLQGCIYGVAKNLIGDVVFNEGVMSPWLNILIDGEYRFSRFPLTHCGNDEIKNTAAMTKLQDSSFARTLVRPKGEPQGRGECNPTRSRFLRAVWLLVRGVSSAFCSFVF